MNEKKIAVVYARYSSHRQGEQSIEGQLVEAHKYANEHDLKIIHEYIDRAMTGRNDNREAFQQMLKDTAKKQFDTIIIWKIDRFGRNREEIAFNKYRCKKNGVKVVYVAESIPDSPEGVILESVLEGMAEYYSLQLSQNVQRGQRASAEKCQSFGGTCPIGYTIDKSTKKYVINPQMAPVVCSIFEMYAAGSSIADIIKKLNNQGLRTQKGTAFTQNSLHHMLKNPKYIGVYTYKDEIIDNNGVPAIIDNELFMKVQKMLKTNKRKSHQAWNSADYLLTDKLFCGKCGSHMVGESGTSKTGKIYNYYTCISKKKRRACTKKSVQKDWIESLVINKILEILHNEELVNFIADSVYSYYQKQNEENDFIESLRHQLSDIDKALANILKAIEAGIFNQSTKERMDELDSQRSDIQAEISSYELSKTFRLTREQILYFLYRFRDMNIKNEECKKKLIDTFVNSIFVYDDKIVLTFNYSGDDRTVTLSEINNFNEDISDVDGFVQATDKSTSIKTGDMRAPVFLHTAPTTAKRRCLPSKHTSVPNEYILV